jgi:BAI1-associated protein 3
MHVRIINNGSCALHLTAATYWSVEQRLQYHKTDTEHLISLYYQQRLQEQLSTEATEYGVLSVRAYFNHDSLCVEVLNARDVIPLDPNGKHIASDMLGKTIIKPVK